MATVTSAVPGADSLDVSVVTSAPVVMIYLNGLTRSQLPKGVEIVEERQPAPRSEGAATGVKLDEEKNVDLSKTLKELGNIGFRQIRTLAFQRQNKKFRAVMVLVHWKHQKKEDQILPRWRRAGFEAALANDLRDVRVYRNHNETGGNFVLDCGNPVDRGSVAFVENSLGINEHGEFEFFGTGEDEAQG